MSRLVPQWLEVLKVEAGAMNQWMWVALEAGKGKEMDGFPRASGSVASKVLAPRGQTSELQGSRVVNGNCYRWCLKETLLPVS